MILRLFESLCAEHEGKARIRVDFLFWQLTSKKETGSGFASGQVVHASILPTLADATPRVSLEGLRNSSKTCPFGNVGLVKLYFLEGFHPIWAPLRPCTAPLSNMLVFDSLLWHSATTKNPSVEESQLLSKLAK